MANEEKLRDYLKRATADLYETSERLRQLEEKQHEPIAIIGMSCRLPGGVRSPEDLWRLLADGGDAISGFPADRGWDLDDLYDPEGLRPNTSRTREGGFLYDAGDFDPALFKISPREALAMDPQQRLLLEGCWEALEHGGIAPLSLAGTPVGVFAGVMYHNHAASLTSVPPEVDGFLGTGTASSVVSGRVAYVLGLEGPAVTVDTACSSSLVALHLAAQSLRGGECDVALVGGVTVMASASTFVEFSAQGGLAADGRCKSFGAGAGGTGWSEGVGVLVVERLSDAVRLGRRVLAVVAGSAVNQDGASNGLTAPNGPSQQRVIRQALASAGLSPADVDVVEAHGTGTTLGDPIEAQALLATYGQGRPDNEPVLLGSVKSNIGHTQAAAGVAGVIKMVLAMRHGVVPRTLHAEDPSPQVDWDSGALALATETQPWPRTGRPRRAAVSSFGISGTNAHVILALPDAPAENAPAQDAPADDAPTAEDCRPAGWVVSGRSAAGLAGQAARLAGWPGLAAPSTADVGWSLAATRSALEERVVVVGADRAELLAGLRAVADGTDADAVVRGSVTVGGLGVLFPGQGSQRLGMGRELCVAYPVFRRVFDEVCAELDRFLPVPLRSVLFADAEPVDLSRQHVSEHAGLLDETLYTQAGLFAVEVALFEQLRVWGLVPDFLAGHSVGELSAACVAGVLSLPDAARVVAARGRLMGRLPAGGVMVAVSCTAGEAGVAIVAAGTDLVAVAAVNGPRQVVLSGPADQVAAVVAELGPVRTRSLRVSHAFHSPLMAPMTDEFADVLRTVSWHPPTIPIVSNVTGQLLTDQEATDPGYWVRHVLAPVQLHPTMNYLHDHGVRTFLEVGPGSTLTALGPDCLSGSDTTFIPLLRANQPEPHALLTGLARAYVRGAGIDWAAYHHTPATRSVELPTYAFQHQRFWLNARLNSADSSSANSTDHAFWQAVESENLAALNIDPDQPFATALPTLTAWHRRSTELSTINTWRYQITWQPVTQRAAARSAAHCLVVAPAGHPDQATVEAVEEALGATVLRLDPEHGRDAVAAALRDALADDPREIDAVVSLLALDERPLSGFDAVPAGFAASIALIQGLGDAGIDAPLWSATRSAIAIGGTETLHNPTQAMVWGLGTVLAAEHPRRWGGLIDLPATLDDTTRERLRWTVTASHPDDQLAIRPSGLYARRLTPAPSRVDGPKPSWSTRGTALVTGGTGALGARVARWLAQHGAEHLLLLSRRGTAAPGAAELVAELADLGVRATIAACDAGDRDALEAHIAALPADAPLTSVFHTAAVLDDALIDSLQVDQLENALHAKAAAARNLHQVTAGLDLSAFVLFSSLAGTLGGAGQGNYAPGNAFLDALAGHRRRQGLPALSVAWGLWAGAGLAGGEAEATLGLGGAVPMDPDLALAAMARSLEHDETTAIVADLRWDRMLHKGRGQRPIPLIRDIPAVRDAQPEPAAETSGLARRLAGMTGPERVRAIHDLVRAEVAAALGHTSAGAVATDRAFQDLGFTSVSAIELRNRLDAATGLTLPATLAFDYPTPHALAERLRAMLLADETPLTPSPAGPAGVADAAIAIVAMSCRFPGGVESPEDLWSLLTTGADALSGFPVDRGWDLDSLYHPEPGRPGASYTARGGFLHDAGGFDADFFGINPREALSMDPQQRLLLEASWEAIERAGIDPTTLKGTPVGVFAGTSGQDYGSGRIFARDLASGYGATGSSASVLSGRVSYVLGLEGPAVTVDTACSSSLVALHLAAQSLRHGECDLALAGGVTVMTTPGAFIEFSLQRGLAEDGRCKAYAAAADGTGWSEGVGVLVVERLSDAQRLGHQVLAVLAGSAVNQDGASNGLTAPNGPSQQRVIRAALTSAGLSTADVDVVEGHGTGTRLGDPIEVQALLATYGQDRSEPVLLGSVKSNLGHAQAAAGVAGIIKMVMAMRHGVVPPTLHVDAPSPQVDWDSGAVSLVTESVPWPQHDRVRRAGVSSFGISGTNAHVILALPDAPHAPDAPDAPDAVAPAVEDVMPAAWVLSGRSTAGPAAQARRLIGWDGLAAAPIGDVGWSLAATRAGFDHRAVVLGADRAELLAGLRAVADGADADGVVRGSVTAGGLAVLFPGQGSQRLGMGRELCVAYPVFRRVFDEVCAELDRFLPVPLRSVLFADAEPVDLSRQHVSEHAGLLDETLYTQAGLFAVEVALFEQLRVWGLVPDFLAGHSVGELSAACVAGVLSLPDAARVVAARGRLMGRLPAGGVMVAVACAVDVAGVAIVAAGTDLVAVAAVNGPQQVVLSGPEDQVAAVVAELGPVRTRSLRVSHAFHSPLMAPMTDEFADVLRTVSWHPPTIPIVSNVTGQLLTDQEATDPGYWVRHVLAPVQLHPTINYLHDHGVRTFLEVGPGGTLSALGPDCLPAADDVAFIALLRAKQPEPHALLTGLARAYVRGAGIDWAAYHHTSGIRPVPLPTYAFQHQHFWLSAAEPDPAAATSTDQAFWQAVESGDLTALSETLHIDPDLPFATALPALTAWRRRSASLDTWRYQVSWHPVVASTATLAAGAWVVVAPDGQEDHPLVAGLRDHGADVVVVGLDGVGPAVHPEVVGVVSLLDGSAAQSLELVQLLVGLGTSARLWCVTRGAVQVDAGDVLLDAVQAQVWGLGRVVALEYPELWGGLIDLPEVVDEQVVVRVCGVLAGGGEDQVAVRASGVYGRRLVRGGGGGRGRGWAPVGTVLITGGTGVLGMRVARWVARSGAECVVLVSRQGGAAAGVEELCVELLELGVRVEVVGVDVADRAALAALRLRLVERGVVVRAVVHAAGAGQGTPLAVMTSDEVAGVMRAKVDGAANLDAVFGGDDLDAFVMFSSIAGVWGSGGQGAYAAANAFLDALAAARRGRGLPGSAIAWGPWAQGGMAQGAVEEQLRQRGLPAMDPEVAIAALADTPPDRDVIVADVDWDRFLPTFTTRRHSPLFSMFTDNRPVDRVEPAAAPRELVDLTAAERARVLVELVRRQAAVVLGHETIDTIAADRAFKQLGFDSLTAVELRDALALRTGLRLPSSLVFDYPTPQALAEHLGREIAGDPATDTTPVFTRGVTDPIVIVGMSCRLPGGVQSPDDLWDLLVAGGDGVSGFPIDRGWSHRTRLAEGAGSFAREGGFLYDAPGFDAEFFGISPREALAMDPQQRQLLETSWEALEHARIAPTSMRGSRTGVFVGASSQGYAAGSFGAVDGVGGHLLTGNATSVLSGRVAYALGLEGPAMTVDTACSSSLVALHLAAQSLRDGECDAALVGGVTVMASANTFVEFSAQGGLAADGRCKSYAAAADGTGWSEGVGVLVVERLSDAQRLGHQVLAVLAGSAVSQDGASNGLTAPNGPAQQRVIRQALAGAGLSPADVDVVEGHGTGTRLGDPIEAQALLATYGQNRTEPMLLGSVKSNIGHTQAAAGVAGIIKMVMAMRHGVVPKTLHVDAASPQVDWDSGAVSLVTESVPWPQRDRVRRAGVSSFGISGTNAHVILALPEALPEALREAVAGELAVDSGAPVGWVVSGRSAAGLAGQAHRLSGWDGLAAVRLGDVGWSLAATRSALEERVVVVGADRAELLAGLRAVADGTDADAVVRGSVTVGGLGVLFPGQGSQRLGMGRELCVAYPVFRRVFDEVCAELDRFLPVSLRSVLFVDDESAGLPGQQAGDCAGLLDETLYTQAGLFAVEVALFEQLRVWGLVPDFLAGHSVGELSAACVAGVLSLPDAARVVAARGRLMGRLPAGGVMVAVACAVDVAGVAIVAAGTDLVAVAAVNGPRQVVLSGPADQVAAVVAELGPVRTRSLRVSHAFHSPLMAPMTDEFADVLRTVSWHPPTIPIVSNVTGQLLTDQEATDPGYWVRHVLAPVQLHPTINYLHDHGVRTFLEVGPGGTLSALGPDCLPTTDSDTAFIALLRGKQPEPLALLTGLAQAHVRGSGIDWAAYHHTSSTRPVALPTYSFQHQHYWLNEPVHDSGESVVDAQFWDAVERGDVSELAKGLTWDQPLGDALPVLASWRRQSRSSDTVDSWRYETIWEKLSDPEPATPSGKRIVLVPAGMENDPVVAGLPDTDVVVAGLKSGGAVELVELVQLLVKQAAPARLWCLTRGAVQVDAGDVLLDAVQAQVWGLGRVVALEYPELWGGLIDLPEVVDERVVARVCGVLAGGGEDQVAVRASGVYGRRLVRGGGGGRGRGWAPVGTVLITGGTGVLGMRVARWVARSGAECVVLVSRQGGAAAGVEELCAELLELGVRVEVVGVDVADRAALAALRLRLVERGVVVRAVVHAAGAGQGTPLAVMTSDEVVEVMRAKVDGAANLDAVFGGDDLDAFVMFSSIAGVWGSGGQGAYAAANAFLDALAAVRRGRGLPGSAIAWGPWAQGGMAQGAVEEQLRQRGLPAMDPEVAIAALADTPPDRDVIVADVDWDRFLPTFTTRRHSPLFGRLAEAQRKEQPAVAGSGTAPDPSAELRSRLSEATEPEQDRILLELVRSEAASVLGHSTPDAVKPRRGFTDLGFDSLLAVQMRDRMIGRTGLSLPTTLVFDYPTPAELAGHLGSQLIAESGPQTVAAAITQLERLLARQPLNAQTDAELLKRLNTLAGSPGPAGSPAPAVADSVAIDSATADEIFDLIQREFGKS